MYRSLTELFGRYDVEVYTEVSPAFIAVQAPLEEKEVSLAA